MKRWRLASLTPIQVNTLTVLGLIAVTKLVAFFKDVLIARYFGVTHHVDLYFYILIIPLFLFNIFSAGFNLFFIPEYLRTEKEKGEASAQAFFIYIRRKIFQASLVLSVVYVPLAVYFIPRLARGFDGIPGLSGEILLLSSGVAIFLLFYILSSVISSLLQAEHFYVDSLLVPILIPAAGVGFMVFFHQALQIHSVVWGMAIGSLVCYLILEQRLRVKCGFFPHGGDFLEEFPEPFKFRELALLFLAVMIPSMADLIDRQMATALGEGALSIFHFGSLVPDGIQGIIGQGLSIGFLSFFSQWYLKGEQRRIVEATQKIIIYLTFFVLPLCCFIIFFAGHIITLLFQRGAFTAADTLAAKDVLRALCLCLFLAPPIIMGVRIISVIGKNKVFLLIAVMMLGLKIIFNVVYTSSWGLVGLPLATNTMFLLINLWLFVYLKRERFPVFTRSLLRELGRAVIFLIVVIAAYSAIAWLMKDAGAIAILLTGAAVSVPFFYIALVLCQRACLKFATSKVL